MASLGQDQRYGLCIGKPDKKTPNRTLFHVKLTDTALRSLEAYQNIKGSLSSGPSICFEGNQGYIKIPASTSESPSTLRVFSFYLSSDSKDQPQASFDCIHQYVSRNHREQLEVKGSIQDKITVCATEDSYQMTRERLSQVEKDSWSRSAIEIKPGATHPSKCIKFQKRPTPLPAIDLKKPSAIRRKNGSVSATTQKPLRERIIHLLALKAFTKPELLLWLEREKAASKDKAELGAVLEEVAKLNVKDNCYLLRNDCYKQVHSDWPGYNGEESQLVSRLLARKFQTHIGNQSKNPRANGSVPKTSDNQSAAKSSMKRLVPCDSRESLATKRPKLTHQRLQQPPAVNRLFNNKGGRNVATPNLNSSVHTKTEFQRTTNQADGHSDMSLSYGGFSTAHKCSGNLDSLVSKTREAKVNSLQPPQPRSDCLQKALANSQHRKKSPKRHKDNERDRLKEATSREWTKASPDLKHNQYQLCYHIISDSAVCEKPDYVLTYTPIESLEQRKHYLEDFFSEYDEYKDLHTRIATIISMFVQLESKIKNLSPGTKEHKIMADQILEKYNKYQKKFPGYREERKRCEYLHEKLSYIKQRVIDYDVSSANL